VSQAPQATGSDTPAPLWRMLAAMVYDTLPVIGIWMMTLFVLVIANDGGTVFGYRVQTVLFLELYAYFALSWVRNRQTLGMRAWKLWLVSDRDRLSFDQATYRFLGALLSLATLGLGYFWRYLNPDQRTWPDLLSKTLIVARIS
jgi:uncharacterized RDD family membrane protein YckC